MDTSFTASEVGWSWRAPSCSSGPLFLFVILSCNSCLSVCPSTHISQGRDGAPHAGASAVKEISWDNINTGKTDSTPLESVRNELEWAGLLAAMDRDSGAWLHALPISFMGLRMDDSAVRTAMGLRLGTTICAPHTC